MDVRTEKGRLEALYVRCFSFSDSAITQLASWAAANDLILIKKRINFSYIQESVRRLAIPTVTQHIFTLQAVIVPTEVKELDEC